MYAEVSTLLLFRPSTPSRSTKASNSGKTDPPSSSTNYLLLVTSNFVRTYSHPSFPGHSEIPTTVAITSYKSHGSQQAAQHGRKPPIRGERLTEWTSGIPNFSPCHLLPYNRTSICTRSCSGFVSEKIAFIDRIGREGK